ncbi:putative transcriptional regulator with HTH domain (plasmid) [Cupriavidus taiwanensis]|uniref:Putative transcriptional regulator with HTH domain n=1 Tax=Cupriavidus taiwanensis TaxID=164546 RepID=A0A375IRH7_9BURK|nr:ATP-binding protein [Cupriavidus taiwanensis]SPK77224.1 putative transcriptional regulator with HTH domain [Cupriavidus taiwanensis]
MTDELLTALRYKSEGTDIDFKSAQYRFIGGNDEDKAEMLKDILAIANAWRDGTGYILLGFKDQRPHPAAIVGITASIDDAKMQQFVHSKVKPKLTFKYEEHLHEGKTVGVITIPKQKRPFYLSHAYGKLKSNVVYVRRGSSTDEAEPPETAAMMQADAGRKDLRLGLSVLAPNNEKLDTTFALNYLKFPERLPDYESPPSETGHFALSLAISSVWHDNKNFWRQYAEYVRVQAALIEMKFILHNHSDVQLSNAKLEMSAEPLDGQGFQMISGADLPNEPETQWSSLHGIRSLPEILDRQNTQMVVDNSGRSPVCRVRFGSLLPGEEGRSSDTVAIVPLGPGRLRLRLRILGAEIAVPEESEHVLEATGDVRVLDVDGLGEIRGKSLLERYQLTGK